MCEAEKIPLVLWDLESRYCILSQTIVYLLDLNNSEAGPTFIAFYLLELDYWNSNINI